MKYHKKHLEILTKIKKRSYNPLQHKLHKKYRISRKTLFYIKEYGTKTNVVKTIIKESIKILLMASILSSFGGLALEQIKVIFISITPLIILFPVLNDLTGDYGSIIASKFSTMLHEGKIKGKIWKNKNLIKLSLQILIIGIISAILSALLALTISKVMMGNLNTFTSIKILLITIINILVIVTILFFISFFMGLYYFRKKEDPNNFLIPIVTSVADFGNIILLSILVLLFF